MLAPSLLYLFRPLYSQGWCLLMKCWMLLFISWCLLSSYHMVGTDLTMRIGGGLVAKSCLSNLMTLATSWTVACQAPLSMEFSRQEYWSGLPFSSSGDLPDPGIKPVSPALRAGRFFTNYKGSYKGSPLKVLMVVVCGLATRIIREQNRQSPWPPGACIQWGLV